MTVHGFPGYARSDDIPTTIGVLDGEGNTDSIRVDIEPGSRWRYAGGGYTVMQQLLMDVLGEPFPQIMRETVLEPFGMSVSTYEQPLPETRWANAATGYRANGDPVEEKWHVYPEMAAAGLWTTPSDLARFAIQIQQAYAGQSNAVLSTQMAREMLTPHANNWGLGPAIQDDGARFSHGGANEGFRCQLTAFNEGGRGAAIMTNSDAGGELANEVLFTIGVVYDWPGFEPTEKTVAQIDPAIYQQVAGRYDFPDLGVIVIEQADGSLWVETPDGDRLELLPESENVFFLRDNGRRVTFVRENGRVMAFIYGRMRAERIE
jgi:CubicO group peptidase (beta-lactamase class C family)